MCVIHVLPSWGVKDEMCLPIGKHLCGLGYSRGYPAQPRTRVRGTVHLPVLKCTVNPGTDWRARRARHARLCGALFAFAANLTHLPVVRKERVICRARVTTLWPIGQLVSTYMLPMMLQLPLTNDTTSPPAEQSPPAGQFKQLGSVDLGAGARGLIE